MSINIDYPYEGKQATAPELLEARIMNVNYPKGEAEWWALKEITRLRAELDEARSRISQLEAARTGYAKEFPLDEEGLPDVGSIHQNIRRLKAELAEARRERDEAVTIGLP